MLRSMTGFGKADRELDGDIISIEISAVNHRYLDTSVRLPNTWWALEPVLKETVRAQMSRGKVNVIVNRKRGLGGQRQNVYLDKAAAQQYIDSAKELVQMMGTIESLSLDVLACMEGVFCHEETEADLDRVQEAVVGALKEALDKLDAMRQCEGAALQKELAGRIGLMREALATIELRLPELEKSYEQRLRARIDELKADLAITEDRIAMEIALMADRGDVTEEVVRLKTHFDHTLELLAKSESVGRELNFLSQELQREVNTLGSKVRDPEVTREVLRMKSEVERFREQVQNIE